MTVVLLVVAPATADDAEVIALLEGRWVYAGDDAERQRRLDAIDATVREMAWLIRGIARRRITASTEIHKSYEFRIEDGRVSIVEDGESGHAAPWDGTPVEIPKSDGGPATLTRTCSDGGLRSHWQEPKGSGTEVYRPSADGQSMTVTVIVSSARLPSDVRYQLSYLRAR